jgi:hypothetical protein
MSVRMKKIFAVTCFLFALNISAQVRPPFTDIQTFIDFNLPNEESTPDLPDSIPSKNRASINVWLTTGGFQDIQEIRLGVGPVTNNNTYLDRTLTSPFGNTENLLPLADIIKFDPPIESIWLTIRVKFNNGTLSDRSFIQIK